MGSCNSSKSQQDQASLDDLRQSRYLEEEVCNKLSKEKFNDCKKICYDIYLNGQDRNKCVELEVGLIKDLEQTYKNLKQANYLDKIDSDLFFAYINIRSDSTALKKIIQDYSHGDAEDFLFWIINNSQIAEVFRRHDDSYNILETLFKEFDSGYKSHSLWKSFTDKVDGEYFMKILINKGEKILLWFTNFINEKNPSCANDTYTRKCFEVYCKIGDKLDDIDRENWASYDKFHKYLNKIIDEKINSQQKSGKDGNPNGWIHEDAPGYTRDQIKDVDDIDTDWVKALCMDLD